MSVHITYFVHGTTTDNERHVSSGWKDVELSELGVKQSVDLKEQTKDKTFDVVFCSDLQRAHNSAKLSWEGLYAIIPDARLRGHPREITAVQKRALSDRVEQKSGAKNRRA
jgi:broad specificity phosphatase PhoE